jgi:lipoprotein-anchoring transpeptidase ErfK/SrfK
MRRLVGISSKTQKATMASIAIVICLTSLHMAAAARIAALQREQEKLESSAATIRESTVSQVQFSSTTKPIEQSYAPAAAPTKIETSPSNQRVATPKPSNIAAGPQRQIIISIPDRKLALLEDGRVLKTYPIAVGTRHTPSPDGDFIVINRAKDPTYRHRDKEIPPGKENPLGTRWMGLSLKGYGIHGTNVQSSVGKAASHGCFRMRKQDVEELYTLVHVGDTVSVRRERDAMIARVFSAPENSQGMTVAKSEANTETQVAAATISTVETTEQ